MPIPSPWLDAAALQALATRFGGEKPAALGRGFLFAAAAGPCAVRDRAGFVPATALPSKDKAGGPMPDLTRKVDESILIRFVVTRDGRVVDPLLVLDGKASESTATHVLPSLVRDRYEAAKVDGEPVASCEVIEILRSTFAQPVRIYQSEGLSIR